MTRLKILHLVSGEFYAGAERVQEMLLRYLDRDRFDPWCIALIDGAFVRQARETGLPVEVLPMRHKADASAVWKLATRLREGGFDLVHTHNVRSHLIGRLAARLARVPVISHVHSPPLHETGNVVRDFLGDTLDRVTRGWSTHHICVSHSLRRRLLSQGVPARQVTVVHNGIDLEGFRVNGSADVERIRGEVRDELDLPSDAKLLTTVALFRPRKGTEVFVEALARLIHNHKDSDAYGLLVGDFESGRYQERIVRLAQHLRLLDQDHSRLRFSGFRSDVSRILSAADVFVLPSLYGEGLPLVVLEAMAMGKPVVATMVEGVPEVVRDGETGLLVPPGDAAELASAVVRLLCDPGWAAELGAQACRRVQDHHRARAMVRKIEEIYEAIADRNGNGDGHGDRHRS